MTAIDLVSNETTLRRLWALDGEEYADGNIPFESLARWWQRYDLGLRIVTNDSLEITGAVGIWSMNEAQTRALIAGTLHESDILPTRCSALDAQPSQFWYISGIFTRNTGGLNATLRRLLRAGVGSWTNCPHVTYPLYCYALGYSEQGIRLLKRFGFEQIKSPEETADRMPLYVREFKTLSELRGSAL